MADLTNKSVFTVLDDVLPDNIARPSNYNEAIYLLGEFQKPEFQESNSLKYLAKASHWLAEFIILCYRCLESNNRNNSFLTFLEFSIMILNGLLN